MSPLTTFFLLILCYAVFAVYTWYLAESVGKSLPAEARDLVRGLVTVVWPAALLVVMLVGVGGLVYTVAATLPSVFRTAGRGATQLWQLLPWPKRSNLPKATAREKRP